MINYYFLVYRNLSPDVRSVSYTNSNIKLQNEVEKTQRKNSQTRNYVTREDNCHIKPAVLENQQKTGQNSMIVEHTTTSKYIEDREANVHQIPYVPPKNNRVRSEKEVGSKAKIIKTEDISFTKKISPKSTNIPIR